MASKKGVELLKAFGEFCAKSKGYDSVLKNITITGGGDGVCLAEFKVRHDQLNKIGGLHGGFTATIVDNFTTYALLTKDKPGGVTVDLHVSYLKGAIEGDDVLIEAKTLKAGKTLAFLHCELKHKKDGSTIAIGQHTKYIALP